MIALVIGGSGSGKSQFAEDMCKGKSPLSYIATMKPCGSEAEERIKRHRKMRKDKGFTTLECCSNLHTLNLRGTVLLECMSNLLANEIFDEGLSPNKATDKIMSGVNKLFSNCENTVIVTNDIFSYSESYSPQLEEYISALGRINREIAQKADIVVEVVAGIPIYHKGGSYDN